MTRLIIALALLSALAAPAFADTAQATCKIVPESATEASSEGPCTFYQAQGHVVITMEDGQEFDLMPTDQYATYTDAEGRPAHRTEELGSEGNAYRLEDVTVYVYW
jgi:hypothetical protein